MNQTRNLRRAVLLVTALLLAALAGGTRLLQHRLEQSSARAAEEMVQQVARVVENTVNRHFVQVDGILAGLPALLGQIAGDGSLAPLAASRLLRDINFQNFNFRDLLLVRPDGQPWASALPASRQRPVPLDQAALAAGNEAGSVTIAGPTRNLLTGEWGLFFIRPIALPGVGQLLAMAEVPVPLIATFLAPVGEVPGLKLVLERSDGRLLASLPHDETRIGRQLQPPASQLRRDGRAIRMAGRQGTEEVILAARPTLYRDIHAVASYEMPSAMALSKRDRDRLLLVAIVAGVLMLALAFALDAALRQRERAEAERAHSRQVLESAIEAMPDGFVMFDAEDRLVTCNRRYRDLYAISAPLIRPGARFEDIIREGARRGQYPQAGEDIEKFVRATLEFHRGNQPPMERLLPDGRWLLVSSRRIPDGGTVGIRTEITAMKRAMREIAEARDAAAAATEAKSRFLARMSHELRTPLNGVLGLAQALARDPSLGPEQRGRAATLEQAGRHLLSVANDVLDLARVEAGRLDLAPAPTHLPALLDACARMTRPAAEAKRITLSLDLDPALPVGVEADQTRLRQLVLNLLSNAVKFTPEGGHVALRAGLAGAPPGGGEPRRVRIEVTDTGPGVPKSFRDAVFRDFVQLGLQSGGSGLGLAIARHIVDQMEGQIGCADVPEGRGGALFWVELPLRPTALPQDTALPGPEGRTSSLRLLVADDIAVNQAVLKALLGAAGHVVECVDDGAAAVAAVVRAAAAGTPFDGVLMDVMMPGTSGLEAARQIRALPGAAATVPILAVTAGGFPEDLAACRAAGMDGHITKPIEREALILALRQLGQRRDGAALPARPLPDLGAEPLLRRGGGVSIPGLDRDATRRLAPEFIAEIRSALAGLRQAGPEDRVPLAHRLAGAAGTLGAARLAAAARHLQASSPGSVEAKLLAEQVAAIAEETLAALASGAEAGRAA